MSRVFKKRPKVFFGTQRFKMIPTRPPSHPPEVDEAESHAEAPAERPIPVETASSKKLAISPQCPSSSGPSEGLSSASHPVLPVLVNLLTMWEK